MAKVDEIIAGWKNLVFPTPEIEGMAINRIKICCDCDQLSMVNICCVCHCFMPSKTRSPKSKCPLSKW